LGFSFIRCSKSNQFGHSSLSFSTLHSARGQKKKCGDMAVDNILHATNRLELDTPCSKII